MKQSSEPTEFVFEQADGETWSVCHTRPRCEKKFAALMKAEAMVHYLPLFTSVRHYGRQTKRFTKPLFPGYVFVRIPADRRPRIFQQDLLARVLATEDENKLIEQLRVVDRVVSAGLEVSLHPLMKKGMRVKVMSGPLRGLEGVVDDPKNPKGIVVELDVLQKGLLVKLTLDTLEPLP